MCSFWVFLSHSCKLRSLRNSILPMTAAVDVDERLHGRHEEGAGAAGRIEQAQDGQNLVQELPAEGGVEGQQEVADGVEVAKRGAPGAALFTRSRISW